jgi:hypothetical protein
LVLTIVRSTSFQNILFGVARLVGLDPYRDLNTTRAATITEFINGRLTEGWKRDYWPEWTVTEKRAYRDVYASGQNVTPGIEVYFIAADRYYQALQAQASATQAPATWDGTQWVENSAYWAECRPYYKNDWWAAGTVYSIGHQVRRLEDGLSYQCIVPHTSGNAWDASKWGVLTAFSRYVAYEQTGKTPIGEVSRVTRKDPRVFCDTYGEVGFFTIEEGIQVDNSAPNSVWVEFRKRPPVFTFTPWNVTTAYIAGDVVYYPTTGQCYVALVNTTGQIPSSNATVWQVVAFPLILGSFVKRAVAADMMTEQKQNDRATRLLYGVPGTEDRGAYGELSDAQDREFAGQGQWDTAKVVTY